jgi:predicted  nucleic acid-binding Zn-ribbon protein
MPSNELITIILSVLAALGTLYTGISQVKLSRKKAELDSMGVLITGYGSLCDDLRERIAQLNESVDKYQRDLIADSKQREEERRYFNDKIESLQNALRLSDDKVAGLQKENVVLRKKIAELERAR